MKTVAHKTHGSNDSIEPRLRLIAWEITRNCNLYCAHCRAASENCKYEGELTTDECYRVIDDIITIGKPIIILSGGEPLVRKDVFEIGKYLVSRGLRVVMGTNGTLLTKEAVAKLKEVPIARLAISLDFPIPQLQDEFRGQSGAFKAAMAGIRNAQEAGIEIQINSTVTRLNKKYLNGLLNLALEVGALAFHPFFLVPTGRGKTLASQELSSEEYEETLNWIYEKQAELGERIFFKPTDAPHYMRILAQRLKNTPLKPSLGGAVHGLHSMTRGCLAGTGFCFISHRGVVQGCGYLSVPAGNIREEPFHNIWLRSPLFNKLRDISNMKGKCGFCQFKKICGGCRARAFESTGDCLEAEPYCVFNPGRYPNIEE